jgi:vanillate/3-O-methylgallate O-demethylase
MHTDSLEAAIQRVGDPVTLLRNSPIRPHTFPVTPEFSNWRSEQRAWRDGCALLDQSHHMTDLYLEGPGALGLLRDVGVNSFERFAAGKAKQFVAVNPRGQFIGDCVLFALDDQLFDLVGHPMVLDWVAYNLEAGGYDARVTRDDNSFDRADGPPKVFRFELQGPTAQSIVEELIGGPVPEIAFFNMTEFTIAERTIRALRHGMAGQPGFELFGPWADGERVRDAILKAGDGLGLVQVGAKAYSTANLESGWIPSPTPAIFSGADMQGYREWLPASAMGSLGGSLDSTDIEDYYLTPYDLGYGRLVRFDRDFIGRDALEQIATRPRRTKVTLVWNREDVTAAIGSLYAPGTPAKYIELPKARYALYQADQVIYGGRRVGISMDAGYIANEHLMVSLASVDSELAQPGTEVAVIWGERPNTAKPLVEEHRQVEIRATVAPCPYEPFARDRYRVDGPRI